MCLCVHLYYAAKIYGKETGGCVEENAKVCLRKITNKRNIKYTKTRVDTHIVVKSNNF